MCVQIDHRFNLILLMMPVENLPQPAEEEPLPAEELSPAAIYCFCSLIDKGYSIGCENQINCKNYLEVLERI